MAARLGTAVNAAYQPKVEAARRSMIAALRADGLDDALGLAGILAGCSADRPCRSGACPVCGADFQLAVYELIAATIKALARGLRGRMHTLTIVSRAGCVGANDLSVEVVEQVKAEVIAALVACGITATVGSIDISFNEDAERQIPRHWCVHVHTVGLDWLTEKQIKALRKYFPASALVDRPVKYQALDKNPNGILYNFKPSRVRRVSYITEVKADSVRSAHRATHRRELRPWQLVFQGLVEHDVGYRGRFITHEIEKNAVEAVFNGFYRARDSPE